MRTEREHGEQAGMPSHLPMILPHFCTGETLVPDLKEQKGIKKEGEFRGREGRTTYQHPPGNRETERQDDLLINHHSL